MAIPCSVCSSANAKTVALSHVAFCLSCIKSAVIRGDRGTEDCISCGLKGSPQTLMIGSTGVCPECLAIVAEYFAVPGLVRAPPSAEHLLARIAELKQMQKRDLAVAKVGARPIGATKSSTIKRALSDAVEAGTRAHRALTSGGPGSVDIQGLLLLIKGIIHLVNALIDTESTPEHKN